jgi:hypothetical protein
MFTGFASENTPAIQVWNYFQTSASTSAVRSVSLADDCAPIQYFKTGSNTTAIRLYLPTAPIEGKQIKIVNANYTSTDQSINVYSSDTNGVGTTNPFIVIGSGQTLDLCYSKDFIFVNASGQFNTGWISLNQSPIGAYAFNAVVVGGNNNSAVASRAAVIGGSVNSASGQSSGVFGGSSNTASSTSATVVGGSSNTAAGSNAAVIGGSSNNASGQGSENAIVGGNNNTAGSIRGGIFAGQQNTVSSSSDYGVILGGFNNTTNSVYGTVINGAYGTTRAIWGNTVLPASGRPVAAVSGVQQSATLVLGRQTTDATATVLASNNSAASTTNQVILPNNSAYTFQGTCIANVTAGGTTSGWKFEGVIKRGANAASTTLVAAVTPTVIAQDAGAVTWVLAITADTTNGGIKVEVTGAAATTIRWVVKIETTEVTF